jgi:acetyl-CoA carboxylase carboxyl transferase subunit alpha
MILEFEKPIRELEEKILNQRRFAEGDVALQEEIARLERALGVARKRVYSTLSPYQRVQVARHPNRPNLRAYLDSLTEDFYELAGDRLYGEDTAVRGGFAKMAGRNVVLVGHDKGEDVSSRVKNNFGMAHPEGYRKAGRLYALAEKLRLPIVTLVDTPGAFAGRGAEERGQAWAISADLMILAQVSVPVVAVVVGEGGSGGALAMCVADHVAMLENSYLSVIAPESCASIIFRDAGRASQAAAAMKLTAEDLLVHGIVDEVIPEPLGGAHQDTKVSVDAVGEAVGRALSRLMHVAPEVLVDRRHERYRRIGAHTSIEEIEKRLQAMQGP